MTWGRLDDKFWGHRKVVSSGNVGAGLVARLISWSSDHRTGGHVTREVCVMLAAAERPAMRRLGVRLPKGFEDKLVDLVAENGFLDPAGDDAFQIHDFHRYAFDAEAAEKQRKQSAERSRRYRGKKREREEVIIKTDVTGDVTRDCSSVEPKAATASSESSKPLIEGHVTSRATSRDGHRDASRSRPYPDPGYAHTHGGEGARARSNGNANGRERPSEPPSSEAAQNAFKRHGDSAPSPSHVPAQKSPPAADQAPGSDPVTLDLWDALKGHPDLTAIATWKLAGKIAARVHTGGQRAEDLKRAIRDAAAEAEMQAAGGNPMSQRDLLSTLRRYCDHAKPPAPGANGARYPNRNAEQTKNRPSL